MFYLVTGGSASGKSEYGENLILSLGQRNRIYVATMIPWDEECRRRIARHRQLRAKKGFTTVEQYRNLHTLRLEDGTGKPAAVLLECMSNLAANEWFSGETPVSEAAADHGTKRLFPAAFSRQEQEERLKRAGDKIILGVTALRGQCRDLAVVTNEVFSQGTGYSQEVRDYLELLGRVNQRLADMADQVTEVVFGVPVVIKGEGKRKEPGV